MKMKAVLSTILKSLLVGAAYVIAVAVGGMIVTLLGFRLPAAENPTASLMWFFVGGVIAGLSLGSVAPTSPSPPFSETGDCRVGRCRNNAGLSLTRSPKSPTLAAKSGDFALRAKVLYILH